jgi:sialidase-1
VCQGSLIRYDFTGKPPLLVFSNPASKEKRIGMTVRLSFDDGKTWPAHKVLYQGPSAYSNVTVLPNGNLGCFYEAGYAKAYEGIVFEEVSMNSLMNNQAQRN